MNNTQTLNIFMKVNIFMQAFMVKAKTTIDNEGYDAIIDMWNKEENQEELKATLQEIIKTNRKRTKKIKDPNAPKRSKSAYIYYCSDFRAAAKAELGEGVKMGQVGKELGRMWNEAKYANRVDKYIRLAAKDKERYKKEMETYQRPTDEDLEEMNKQKKKKRKKGYKKRGRSAYIFFCTEERAKLKTENVKLGPKEIITELAHRWKEAKKGDTTKWEILAKADKEKSSQEINSKSEINNSEEDKSEEGKSEEDKSEEGKSYGKSEEGKSYDKSYDKSEEGKSDGKILRKKISRKKKRRMYGVREWKKYHQAAIEKSTGLNGTDLTRELAKQWKALSNDKRDEWREKAKQINNS